MSPAEFVARLEGAISRGEGRWCARCPAHEDRSPSLSIGTGDDGRILINCFAGCDPTSVITAMGLAWRDLYPDPWECARRRPNEAATNYARRTIAAADPLDIERTVLRIVAADIRAGRQPSAEDRARVEVARLRLRAAEGDAA